MTTRRALERAGVASIWAGLTSIVVYAWAVIARSSWRSEDYYWSLAVGRWMMHHHALMRADVFSYTMHGRPEVLTEWLYDWGLAALVHADAGAVGPVMLGIWAAGMATSVWYLRRVGASWGRVGLVGAVLGVVNTALEMQGRALGLSLILVPAVLLITRAGRDNPRWLWLLGPLFALWVNVHGSVLLGLVIVLVEAFWAWVPATWMAGMGGRSTKRGALAWAVGASVVGASVSPWGPGLLAYDLRLSHNAQIAALINEWQSPNLASVLWMVVLLAVAGVLGRALWLRRGEAVLVSLAVGCTLGWLHAIRFAPYMLLTVGALFVSDPAPVAARRYALGLGAAAAALSIVVTVNSVTVPPSRIGPALTMAPRGAVSFLHTQKSGRVFTYYDWSSYGISRGIASFVDGRVDFFTGRILGIYMNVSDGASPVSALAPWHVRYVLWPSRTTLSTELSQDPAWRLIYHHGIVEVFERAGSRANG